MSRASLATLGVLAFAFSACERIDAPAESTSDKLTTPEGAGLDFLSSDPRLTVAHAGLRRLEFASDAGPALAFQERIVTDGQGRYSIQPEGPSGSSVADWGLFELTQRAREGFLFRYRDFCVRDPQLFATNWSVIHEGESVIAGRACESYRVVRTSGAPRAFALGVDGQTGLILSVHEYGAEGELAASMVYESLDSQPDLSTVAWHQNSNQEVVFGSAEALEAELGFSPLEPRLLPQGYAPLELARVADGRGGSWIKRTYSDGLEPLFFFQGITPSQSGNPVGKKLGQHDLLSGSPPNTDSAVVVFDLGSALALQGEVEGFDLMAIGRVSEPELLDLVESSLP
jgi:hypothetical protein